MKKATIALAELKECLVDQICVSGARIHLTETHDIPIEFYIFIEGDETPRYCAITCRSLHHVQVCFV